MSLALALAFTGRERKEGLGWDWIWRVDLLAGLSVDLYRVIGIFFSRGRIS
jgi:hypothetical protein